MDSLWEREAMVIRVWVIACASSRAAWEKESGELDVDLREGREVDAREIVVDTRESRDV